MLQADDISYDQKAKTVTASGHVEVAYDKQVLRADKIVYHQDTGVVRAEGNVRIHQPSGDVLFAKESELTSNMAQGFVDQVSILFKDGSRMAAADAQLYEGRYLIADRGLYTACDVCKNDPSKPPLWQIKAKRVTDDNVKKDVIYRDATVEFAGIPLLYTPYFAHPEPSVKQRQGFLTPAGGNSKNLGIFTRVPYYFVFSPSSDLTFSPTFSEEDNGQLALTWRQRFDRANMKWNGSFTYTDLISDQGIDKGKQGRGHLFGDVLYNFDNQWRAGGKIALTTDKSYLSRYSISHEDVLVNQGLVENFFGRNYGSANFYYFQDLRPGSQDASPIVAPEISFSRLGEPGKTLGGRWSLDGGILVTARSRDVALAQQGPDTRRLSLKSGWDREFVSSTGFLTSLSAQARGDAYWADNVEDPNSTTHRYQKVTRVRPFTQGNVMVRYPFGRSGDGYQQILEPIGQFTVAPNVRTENKIPNEDSLDVEFDETNLFAQNRFTGIDRVEGGMRAAYGLRHSLISDNGGRVDMLAGQSYRLKKNLQFPEESGLRNNSSDYVARIDIVPGDWMDINYGVMLAKNDFAMERQEVRGNFGIPEFRPFFTYISTKRTLVNGAYTPLEEIYGGISSTFAKYYNIIIAQDRAIKPDAGERMTSISANYRDECFLFGITGQRNKTSRADLVSGDSIMFHFYLRNIGGLQTDSFDSPIRDQLLSTNKTDAYLPASSVMQREQRLF